MARKKPPAIGTPVTVGPQQWVQTERAAHEAWERLIARRPMAARLMHVLVANIGHQNAVMVPQQTLAKILGCTTRTVRNAIRDLRDERWIDVVQLGAASSINCYVINSAVAWAEKRENLKLAIFTAQVIADAEDQPADALDRSALRRIPVLYPGEQQFPAGEGEAPPSEPSLPGFEADLPGIESE
jgi:hypothetical protein